MKIELKITVVLIAVIAKDFAHAIENFKANNADNLNLTNSWRGNKVPGAGDIASWTNNSGSSMVNLGSDMAWNGVNVSSLGATPSILDGNPSQQWAFNLVARFGPRPSPVLTVQSAGYGAELSWPTNYTNYMLQKLSGSLDSSSNAPWQNVTNVIFNHYSETATNSSSFFG